MLANLPEADGDFTVCSYEDFLCKQHPRNKEASDEEKKEYNTKMAVLRAKFAAAGGAGSKFRSTQDKMLKSLSLPKGAREELGIQGDGGMPPLAEEPKKNEDAEDSDTDDMIAEKARLRREAVMLHRLFNEGRYHLIPGFFRTLMYLKKQKKEFSVVFRTFGQDLDEVVFEFDKFCSGEHPCFNGRNNMPLVKMDGAKNTKDFRF